MKFKKKTLWIFYRLRNIFNCVSCSIRDTSLRDFSILWLSVKHTDYGRPVRKSPSLHGQKSTPTPKFLGTTEAFFCLPHQPKFSDFFNLCLHGVSVVRGKTASLPFTEWLFKIPNWAVRHIFLRKQNLKFSQHFKLRPALCIVCLFICSFIKTIWSVQKCMNFHFLFFPQWR